MSYLWDSNILRHYLDDHPLLLENLARVPRRDVLVPVVVAAEQFRGRAEAILKAEPVRLARAQELFRQTHELVNKFQILYFDEAALTLTAQLIARSKTRRRYPDVLMAAQAIAGRHILVTRNTRDFHDLLPAPQLQNWIDEKLD